MAHLGNGWVSCWMRSGRYTYRKVVVHTTNPDHLIPSTGQRRQEGRRQIAAFARQIADYQRAVER